MLKIINKIKKNKKVILSAALLGVVFILMVKAGNVWAYETDLYDPDNKSGINATGAFSGIGYAVAMILSFIALIITSVLGLVITLLIQILVNVANFNHIIDVEAVKVGWVAVRDLCNMFFILILLVIAFATILKIENYNAKKLLPKLVIMAVLINFSRMICGLIIDFSQVIMLTFANSFSSGQGWFVEMLKMRNWVSVNELAQNLKTESTNNSALTGWGTAMAVIAGVFAALITVIVIAIMLAVLVMRIIMLWIYTILSPLAFLAAAFPAGQKYSSQWWGEFMKNVVVGPALAFFIWLALTTSDLSSKALGDGIQTAKTDALCVGGSAFFCDVSFQRFIITIGLLTGGLMVAQQAGGAIGSIAGKGLGAVRGVGRLGAVGAFWAGRKLDDFQVGLQEKFFGKGDKNFRGKSLNYRMIAEGWKARRAERMSEYESGKAGAWQDRFDRALTAQGSTVGEKFKSKIPIVAALQRVKARQKMEKDQKSLNDSNEVIQRLEENLKTESDQDKRSAIMSGIQKEKENIRNKKKSIVEESKKLPDSRRAQYDKNSRIYEHFNEIKKYNLTEDELVKAYMQEKNKDKRKAYFQHLVDINGVNTLFDTRGIDYTFEGVQNFLKEEFKEDAGDVAEEMSKRAEAAGNYKLIGHGRLNLSTGKNELISKGAKSYEEAYAAKRIVESRKRKEKFSQNFARTTHKDDLIDIMSDGSSMLSLGGVDTALEIARDKNRMSEIEKGNYQTRFAEVFANMDEKGITDAGAKAKLKPEEIEELRSVVAKFKEKYVSRIQAEQKSKSEEELKKA